MTAARAGALGLPAGDAPAGGLGRLVAGAGALLLDFDGPVCGVYAGRPAAGAADRLRQIMARRGAAVPARLAAEPDPLALLRHAADRAEPTGEATGVLDAALVGELDAALAAYELTAVRTAEPTPHAHRAVSEAASAGLPVGIVSNNAAAAIRAYLAAQRLDDLVAVVVGRPARNPAGMKPHPGPVRRAARELGVDPRDCLLVGDSASDVLAGRAAGAATVGFANRPGKAAALTGADIVIDCLGHLADALTRRDRRGA